MFLYWNWTRLSIVTRMKIAEKFGIKKTGSTHVSNNEIQHDGYAIKDVENGLNLNAVKSFLETEENDMSKLWTMLIDKIEGKTPLAKAEEKIVEQLNVPVEEKKESATLYPVPKVVAETPAPEVKKKTKTSKKK